MNTPTNTLRDSILRVGTVSKASVVWTSKVYEDGTITPLKSTSQEIVEIGIDDLMALIETDKAIVVREAYELLFWKYKELNDQSVDMKFAEAYGILMDELGERGTAPITDTALQSQERSQS